MKYITLYNGVKMPMLGFGTYLVNDEVEGLEAIRAAIRAGYRLIDTAFVYKNEQFVGQAIKESGIPREEFFITTKVSFKRHGDVIPTLEESFKKLRTDYIDLVLIHWPWGDYYSAWKVLEDYYKKGKIRAIGVSNFDNGRLYDLWYFSEIKPMVNQIELSVYVQKDEEREFNKDLNCVVQSYGPLGHGKLPDLVKEDILQDIGRKYNKTGAQIALRYLIDIGVPIIPKSVHENRIIENFNILDFELDEEDKKRIRTLNTGTPTTGDAGDPKTMKRIFEKDGW